MLGAAAAYSSRWSEVTCEHRPPRGTGRATQLRTESRSAFFYCVSLFPCRPSGGPFLASCQLLAVAVSPWVSGQLPLQSRPPWSRGLLPGCLCVCVSGSTFPLLRRTGVPGFVPALVQDGPFLT